MSTLGVADYPDKELLETLWKSGMKAKAIIDYLIEHDLPLVSYAALGKYGQRNWNDNESDTTDYMFDGPLEELEYVVADIKESNIGSVERISVSKTGYNISIKPLSPLESVLSDLKTKEVHVPRKKSSSLKSDTEPSTHIIIPDTQLEPGRPNDHLYWASQYMRDKFTGRKDIKVIHLGDHWNMGSLSSYDRGKGAMEGRRVIEDLNAGERGMELLESEISMEEWDKYLLRGNHEERLQKAINDNIQLQGILSDDNFVSPASWEICPFLEPVDIDGIIYSHYFYHPNTGKSYGGENIDTRLKTIGHSFVQGHQQGFKMGTRYINGKQQIGISAGSFYQHEEGYMGPQGTGYWRGIVILHDVQNGSCENPQLVSLDQLCKTYEGHPISEHEGVEI